MSATDELRAELTKRGIKWRWQDERTTFWYATVDGEEWGEWTATEMGGYLLLSFTSGDLLTPAQAIAATLGRGTLTAEQVSRATYAHSIHADCADADWQAIADELNATLGSDDTFTREDVEGAFVSGYSLGLDMFDSSKPDNEKGWNQNERDMDEEMEDLGWVRKDAAKLGTGTCRNAAPSYLDFLCSECGFVNYHSDENDSGDNEWHFCPNCGAKVDEVGDEK